MSYTERDLLLTERTVTALEKFIAEQKERFSATAWELEQREQLERLMNEFEEALHVQRQKVNEIRMALRLPPPE